MSKDSAPTPGSALPEQFRNRIVCADSLELMRQLPDGCIDLVVTSPPYNLRAARVRGVEPRGRWRQPTVLMNGYDRHGDDLPPARYTAWQRACLEEMLRLLPEHGAAFYNHKWRIQNGRLDDRHELVVGLPLRQIIIWRRRGGLNFNHRFFLPTYEVVYLLAKPGFRLVPKASALTDVWDIPQVRGSAHPAPFPLELARRAIASTQAHTVLDPFMGSGTTAVAAQQLGRVFLGIDHSPVYCALARQRLAGDPDRA